MVLLCRLTWRGFSWDLVLVVSLENPMEVCVDELGLQLWDSIYIGTASRDDFSLCCITNCPTF